MLTENYCAYLPQKSRPILNKFNSPEIFSADELEFGINSHFDARLGTWSGSFQDECGQNRSNSMSQSMDAHVARDISEYISRVYRISSNARAAKLMSQMPREQYQSQFGLVVGWDTVVGLSAVQIILVNMSLSIVVGSHIDDAAGFGFLQSVQQEVCQQEMPQIVDPKVHLMTFLCQQVRGVENTSIVYL